jgi:hypothetical protein
MAARRAILDLAGNVVQRMKKKKNETVNKSWFDFAGPFITIQGCGNNWLNRWLLTSNWPGAAGP